MIAIYARQSVDRPDSISVDRQIELCSYEARGEECRIYTDRGYSGKNINRPQFVKMMNDVKNGSIHTVIVYKLDRISRSILDFSNMMEQFEKYRVQFISATEKFDTSSPMGKAMLNICIVFAQLERETIQKRVADAYFSRSMKSFYMGGRIPYGFRKVPAVIDGIHTSMYEEIPEEAEQIRLIYKMYAQPNISFGDIIDRLHELGLRKRGKDWQRSRIRDILINPIYVKANIDVYNFFTEHGAHIENPPEDFIGENGCYYYKGQDSDKKKSSVIEGNHIVLAPHKGIIDSQLWLKCREKCMGQKQIKSVQKAKNSWLAGKIKCGECGYALIAKEFRGGKDRYLLCSHRLNSKACRGAGTLYTDEIEELVYSEMKKKLSQFSVLKKSSHTVPHSEITALDIEISGYEAEISNLMKKVSDADPILIKYINERISDLDNKKINAQERLRELRQKTDFSVGETENHLTMWEELSFEDKRLAADTLIHIIHATSDKVTIQWKI